MSQPSADTPTFQEALKQDRAEFDDCSATFVGLGVFTYASGHSQIRANEAAIRASKSMFGVRSRGMAITGTSAVMVALGVYRWFA